MASTTPQDNARPGLDPAPPPPSRRASRRADRSEGLDDRWPDVFATAMYAFSALVVVATFIPPLRRYFASENDIVSMLIVPIVPGLVYAAVLAVMAVALRRRLRAAWWALLIWWLILPEIARIVSIATGGRLIQIVGVVLVAVVIVIMIRARPQFQAHRVPGSLVAALAVFIGGGLVIVVAGTWLVYRFGSVATLNDAYLQVIDAMLGELGQATLPVGGHVPLWIRALLGIVGALRDRGRGHPRPEDLLSERSGDEEVRRSVSRLQRRGYTTQVQRHESLSRADFAVLNADAAQWRGDGGDERGFSMALGRLGDPLDTWCVLVEARDADGALRAFLSFVPWGRNGLSLDLMRRDPSADNGSVELMVACLTERSTHLGVGRVSLNFAMFREAFERGAEIGAGPLSRAWRRALVVASRNWQLESLYRSNAKYQPTWQPRFICFEYASDLPRVGTAAGSAEGFLTRPSISLFRRKGRGGASGRRARAGKFCVCRRGRRTDARPTRHAGRGTCRRPAPRPDAGAPGQGPPPSPTWDRSVPGLSSTEPHLQPDPRAGWGHLLEEIYGVLCESTTRTPVFYTDFPTENSPLTRQHRADPRLAEKWDLVIFAAEQGTAYSELIDPLEQRARLVEQSLQAAAGDPEAMQVDEDFLAALEYGMPPTGGMGMGIGRLVMNLTGLSIRDTILFPLVRPR